MIVDTLIFSVLQGLVANRVFPDVAPELTALPYITFQQVGGQPVNFMDGASPSKKNSRFQINVWANTRLQATTLAAQVETQLRGAAALQATVFSEQIALYEPETKLRGTRQDFSFWVTSII